MKLWLYEGVYHWVTFGMMIILLRWQILSYQMYIMCSPFFLMCYDIFQSHKNWWELKIGKVCLIASSSTYLQYYCFFSILLFLPPESIISVFFCFRIIGRRYIRYTFFVKSQQSLKFVWSLFLGFRLFNWWILLKSFN